MAWQNPKTDWKAGDIPIASDFNRIEGNIQELENTKETPAGAQAKADAAESAAKSYADGVAAGEAGAVQAELDAHLQDKGNPHAVTAAQVGAAPSSHVGAGGAEHPVATTSVAGFMSAVDKSKLDQLGVRYVDVLSPARTPSVADTWEDWDISAYVPPNTAVEIGIESQDNADATSGVRTRGSSVTKVLRSDIYSANGDDGFTMITETDANGVIQIYSTATTTTFEVFGYFTVE